MNKNTHFFYLQIYNNVGYLLKHKFYFTLTITYSVGHFEENIIYIIFEIYKLYNAYYYYYN